MGLAWTHANSLTLQRLFSSAGLVAADSVKPLPRLGSGDETAIPFSFLVPSSAATELESVWRFYAGSEPFGPMLRFRFLLPQKEDKKGEERRGEVTDKLRSVFETSMWRTLLSFSRRTQAL
jgi:hypothetical protein